MNKKNLLMLTIKSQFVRIYLALIFYVAIIEISQRNCLIFNSMLNPRIKNLLIGKELDVNDSRTLHKVSLVAFLAWIGLGADGLSSSCYGPSEIMQTLGAHTSLSLIVAFASLITIIVISSSYSQIIELFPEGGGGYIVATKLLSPKWGMVSGCALLIDYMLTITVSIASGADAFFSMLPLNWQYYKLPFAVGILLFLIIINLRGAKESIKILLPIFMVFVIFHLFVIIYAIVTHSFELTTVVERTSNDFSNTVTSLGVFGTFMLLVHSYSMGAGTYTGIEAVSNGLPILKEPKVKTAKKTMRYMMISLSVAVFGLLLAFLLYQIKIQPGKTINAVLFSVMTANWSAPLSHSFIAILLLSEALILFVAAQTGFLDGPRVLSNMAYDKWIPTKFTNLSDRLVSQNGIFVMGIAAMLLLIFSKGNVSFLIVLYSINVFITFFLSQLGMVRHWLKVKEADPKWRKKMLINGTGLMLSGIILIFVIWIKFFEGGWVTILITLSFVFLVGKIKKDYNRTEEQLKKFNEILEVEPLECNIEIPTEPNLRGKTAVLMVSGYSGVGIHSVLGVIKLFGDSIKNFVFISVGQIDSSVLKNHHEVEAINQRLQENLDKYINYVNKIGYYAEGYSSLAYNVNDEINKWIDTVRSRFPDSIFFGGQLVHKKENIFNKYLHNYTVFNIQKSCYYKGVQFIILPLRLST